MLAALLQAALELTGVVLGPGGKPLAGAQVLVGDRKAESDAKGRFSLVLPGPGPAEVRVSAPGMDTQTRTGQPGEPLLVLLTPTPQGALVEVVEGSGYSSQEGATSTLSRMEIYTTPGAAADVMQAAKGLPGVSNASEGAELFVRGGKPEEVGIWLNGGHLTRPFHHPNTQGGIFSAVDTALVTRVDFVPGAFSVRYGDALSAVLDISTDQPTAVSTNTLLLTIPTQGYALERPMGAGLLRASVRRSDTVLLDKWYGLAPSFEESPLSHDAQLNWQHPLGSGRLVATGLFSKDHLATDVTIANLKDSYRNQSDTGFGALQWTGTLGDRAGLSLSASGSQTHIAWTFNHWGIDQRERSRSARAELTMPFGDQLTLEGGADLDRTHVDPQGEVPYDLANWNPAATARTFAYGFDATREGAYLTARLRLTPKWGLSLGGRQDHYGLEQETTRDLRGTLSYLIDEGITFRLAGGTFHQAPLSTQVDPHAGNPDLKIMRATHALASLDAAWKGTAAWNLRLEVYRKDYDRLVVEDPALRYVSTGRGYAQGVDLLLKAALPGWRGWVGYGYLDTERKEDKQPLLGPAPTSVPHNLTAVSSHTLAPGWELAGTFRYASGSPITPVLGATANPGGGWDPLEGARYSDRLPVYHRLDARLTHLFNRWGINCVVFGEVMNLLNRHNAASYAYSADFSQRRVNESYFSRRLLIAGASLSW
ncbi:TonB-dependent receptor [Geothrix sp. PMB-07]|uniref:TonB-dependent receptor n=1 Tax=Geothrix sp. PMB-07 TaxID=3068640 RepID=UPI0027413D6F|nr:TonB-dependent receptor [Geothrix sp. PMB-07]WLT31413.1 TonB-dependent receptor [Geothrix sp. PMB-07]